MAITISAKNMIIKVKNEYNLHVTHKLEKVTNKMNVEATEEDLTLISNNKIQARGNKR